MNEWNWHWHSKENSTNRMKKKSNVVWELYRKQKIKMKCFHLAMGNKVHGKCNVYLFSSLKYGSIYDWNKNNCIGNGVRDIECCALRRFSDDGKIKFVLFGMRRHCLLPRHFIWLPVHCNRLVSHHCVWVTSVGGVKPQIARHFQPDLRINANQRNT